MLRSGAPVRRMSAQSVPALFGPGRSPPRQRRRRADSEERDAPQKGVRRPSAGSRRQRHPQDRAKRPAHPSTRLVAQLNESWRVIDDPLQWILQRKKGSPRKKNSGWRGRSFCRTRDALLRCVAGYCGEIDDNALAELNSLPDWHPDWDSRDDSAKLDVLGTDQVQAEAHSDPLISQGSEAREADSERARSSQSALY